MAFESLEAPRPGPKPEPGKTRDQRMMKWFEYAHLPSHLQGVSMRFHALATFVTESIDPGPERTVALRKLLEAKDSAVRAVVHPGG